MFCSERVWGSEGVSGGWNILRKVTLTPSIWLTKSYSPCLVIWLLYYHIGCVYIIHLVVLLSWLCLMVYFLSNANHVFTFIFNAYFFDWLNEVYFAFLYKMAIMQFIGQFVEAHEQETSYGALLLDLWKLWLDFKSWKHFFNSVDY